MPQTRSSRSEAAKRANALVRACLDLLTLNGCVAVRFNNQPIMQFVNGKPVGYRRLDKYQPAGIPDIWAIAPGGRLVLVECKSGSGRLSADQAKFLDKAERMGALVNVVRDVSQLSSTCRVAREVGWESVQSVWGDVTDKE